MRKHAWAVVVLVLMGISVGPVSAAAGTGMPVAPAAVVVSAEVRAANDFHCRFLSALAAVGRVNDGASPLAARYTSLPLFLAARGKTREAWAKVLTVPVGSQSLAEPLRAIAPTCRKSNEPERLLFGAVWLSTASQYAPARDWMTAMRPVLAVRDLDYAETAFPDQRLREWSEDWFRGSDEAKLEAPREKPDVFAVSILDFDADWAEGYSFGEGARERFRVSAGVTREMRMMRGAATYQVARDEVFTAVRVPCAGERYAMWLLLPHRDLPPPELVKAMSAVRYEGLRSALKPTRAELMLPEVSIRSRCEMGAIFAGMGAPELLKAGVADYRGMVSRETPGPWPVVTLFDQSSDISIGKHGVKARFVTSFCSFFGAKAVAPLPQKIILDHPFLFFVADERTGAIQFGGWVGDPEAK